jgi:hypothetical protein
MLVIVFLNKARFSDHSASEILYACASMVVLIAAKAAVRMTINKDLFFMVQDLVEFTFKANEIDLQFFLIKVKYVPHQWFNPQEKDKLKKEEIYCQQYLLTIKKLICKFKCVIKVS